jgi:hypothetical protein
VAADTVSSSWVADAAPYDPFIASQASDVADTAAASSTATADDGLGFAAEASVASAVDAASSSGASDPVPAQHSGVAAPDRDGDGVEDSLDRCGSTAVRAATSHQPPATSHHPCCPCPCPCCSCHEDLRAACVCACASVDPAGGSGRG